MQFFHRKTFNWDYLTVSEIKSIKAFLVGRMDLVLEELRVLHIDHQAAEVNAALGLA